MNYFHFQELFIKKVKCVKKIKNLLFKNQKMFFIFFKNVT